jgi:hypothetical protein
VVHRYGLVLTLSLFRCRCLVLFGGREPAPLTYSRLNEKTNETLGQFRRGAAPLGGQWLPSPRAVLKQAKVDGF